MRNEVGDDGEDQDDGGGDGEDDCLMFQDCLSVSMRQLGSSKLSLLLVSISEMNRQSAAACSLLSARVFLPSVWLSRDSGRIKNVRDKMLTE